MTPLGRAIVYNSALLRAKDRVASNDRDIASLNDRHRKLEIIYLELTNKVKGKKSVPPASSIYGIPSGAMIFYLKKVIKRTAQFFNRTNIFIRNTYAKAANNYKKQYEKIFLNIFPDGKKRCFYGKNGKCYSLANRARSWSFPSSATKESIAVDRLSAKLADSLQRGPRLTADTILTMVELEKHEKYIKKEYEKSLIVLGSDFFGGPKNFISISNMHHNNYYNSVAKSLGADLAASLKPVGKLPKLISKTLPTAIRRSIVSKRKRKQYRPDKSIQSKETVTQDDNQKRDGGSSFKRSKANYSIRKNDRNHKMKDLTINQNKNLSIFKIITKRYILNLENFTSSTK